MRLRILSLLLLLPSKSHFGWEVVQLVGLQTLDLAILVRVQASQPKTYIPVPRFNARAIGSFAYRVFTVALHFFTAANLCADV